MKNVTKSSKFNMSRTTRKNDLVEEFKATVALGYSEENWLKVSSIYRDLQSCCSLEEMQKIGQVWSSTYASDNFLDEISALTL